MKLRISNSILITDLKTADRLTIEKDLSQDNPDYLSRIKQGRSVWNVPKKENYFKRLYEGLEVPRGYLKTLLEKFEPEQVVDKTSDGFDANFGNWNENIKLREYQVQAVESARKENGVIVCAAGGGKTLIGLKTAHEIGKKTLWIAHTTELMNQVRDRIQNYYSCSVGYVKGQTQKYSISDDIVIASVQTLALYPEIIHKLNEFIGTVIIDEMHRYAAPMFSSVVALLKARHIIGLTATPQRKDNRDMLMFASVGEKLCEIDRFRLYDLGFLVRPEIEFVYTNYDFNQSSQESPAGAVDAGGDDYSFHELIANIVEDKERFQLVINNIIEHYKVGNYQIVLSESVEYGQRITDELTALGYRAEFLHGKVKKKDRLEIMRKCYNKEVPVLVATKLANEGLDMPHLNVGHLVTPKRGDDYGREDGAALEQQIGRIMRPSGSSKLWIDYVDDRNGILRAQYYTRRKTYMRLGLTVPKKKKGSNINNWLQNFA